MEKVELTILVSEFEKETIKELAKEARIGVSQFVINNTIGVKRVKRKRIYRKA